MLYTYLSPYALRISVYMYALRISVYIRAQNPYALCIGMLYAYLYTYMLYAQVHTYTRKILTSTHINVYMAQNTLLRLKKKKKEKT